METLVTNLLLISLIVTYTIGYSGFIENIESFLTRALRSKIRIYVPKPFSCPTCMTFWTCITYISATANVTIPAFLLCCIAAYLSEFELNMMRLISDIFNTLISKIAERL